MSCYFYYLLLNYSFRNNILKQKKNLKLSLNISILITNLLNNSINIAKFFYYIIFISFSKTLEVLYL